MRLYVGYIVAWKENKLDSNLVWALCESEEVAIGVFTKLARGRYSTSDGHYNHQAFVERIPDDLVLKAAEYIQK